MLVNEGGSIGKILASQSSFGIIHGDINPLSYDILFSGNLGDPDQKVFGLYWNGTDYVYSAGKNGAKFTFAGQPKFYVLTYNNAMFKTICGQTAPRPTTWTPTIVVADDLTNEVVTADTYQFSLGSLIIYGYK